MEKFLGIFPRIGRNFSMNISENFLGIFPKLIPRKIHSKTSIFLRKNSELFVRNFFYGKKIKFQRKDFNPSYLRIGKFNDYLNINTCSLHVCSETLYWISHCWWSQVLNTDSSYKLKYARLPDTYDFRSDFKNDNLPAGINLFVYGFQK
jgi:hypothetical protein